MQIFSIPDGITVPDAAPNNTTKTAIRQKLANILGLKTDARFIGVFGKIDPKSKQQLCKTASQLSPHLPSHHLVITGIPKNKDTMDEKLPSRVHMLPRIKENNAYYQALDCCIYFPNTQHFYQGVPWEMTRAMACFCPVIGPDTPGIRDILIDNKTGRLFDPRLSESLPKIIRWTLNTPQAVQTQTQAARALVETHYTMDAMGKSILRIYQLRRIKINRKFQITS